MKHPNLKTKRAAVCLSAVLLFVCLLSCLPSCGKKTVYTSTYFDAFDTVMTLHIPASSHSEAEQISTDIHNLVLSLHKQFDIYHTYDGVSNIKTINDTAGNPTPVAVSQDVIDLLLLGKEMYTKTGGRVNIAMGAVLSLWHIYRQAGRELPPQDDLTTAALSCDIQNLVIDTQHQTVMLTDPQMSLDVGAIAKGYVADKVLAYAKTRGIDSLLFDLGGHILALGTHPNGNPWQVGVRNPHNGGVYTTLSVCDASVVTSGSDQRYYQVEGIKYHHLIDPQTLYPANIHAAVTVVIPFDQTKQADAMSTALFLMPEQEGRALLASLAPKGEGIWISLEP